MTEEVCGTELFGKLEGGHFGPHLQARHSITRFKFSGLNETKKAYFLFLNSARTS